MSKVPELKGGQMLTIAYVIGIIVILFIVYKLLQKVGIIKTAAARKLETDKVVSTEAVRTSDIFDPTYFAKVNHTTIGLSKANMYAEELHNAMVGWGTDEEAIYATFGKLYNKVNVSEVAAAYQVNYSQDLQSDLLNELSEKELVPLWDIINKLPNR
jgi:hypothetical protein